MAKKDHYQHVTLNPKKLTAYPNNSRIHSAKQLQEVEDSITEFGFTNPLLIDEDNMILAGHGRQVVALRMGLKTIPCIIATGLTEDQKRAYVIADNQIALNAEWDIDILTREVTLLLDADYNVEVTGLDESYIEQLLSGEATSKEKYPDGVAGSMTANFGQPPFSILDTRKGDWLTRKREWRELIGDNGESRDNVLGNLGSLGSEVTTVSLLDPVMAELIVNWFGCANGVTFDPFAGDSIFGFVSGTLGMVFHGIELREEQATLNQERCNAAKLPCKYYNDSSENMDKYIRDNSVDLVFSCPPYADLEKYSDDPQDLSNMSHTDFFTIYSKILTNTYAKLKNNRFAVIVMGEVRDKKGNYIETIPNTIRIMRGAGYHYYNEIILVNSAGTLPLRAGKAMRASRKIGSMHQNILVFVKGDAKKAANDLGIIRGKIDFEELLNEQ